MSSNKLSLKYCLHDNQCLGHSVEFMKRKPRSNGNNDKRENVEIYFVDIGVLYEVLKGHETL